MSDKIEECKVTRLGDRVTHRVVAAVELSKLSRGRRFGAWCLMNLPLGFVAPWVAGYVFTGRWQKGSRVL